MMTRFLMLLLLLQAATLACSGQTAVYSSAEMLLHLQKLNTVGSVLYIAAHPDDENTRLLAWLANERKLRTAYLSLTRGDGGQNLVGNEQGELLGLIRTRELLAARRIDGAEQFFTRANDFGFSKNPEETLRFWNKDSVLADMVWVIRHVKPDVLICRFPATGEGGHGHHTASAILALEAFDAAADPTRFPEQLRYTETWQAKRIFWNTFNFGSANTTAEDQLKIDIGAFNPLLGKSYGEIAAESRSMHKSQGFGAAKTRGELIEYFKLLKGDPAPTDLFNGIDLSWSRIPGTAAIQKQISACIKQFNALAPEKILPGLVQVYRGIEQLDENNPVVRYWKKQKLKEANELILQCAGFWMEAYPDEYSAVPGQTLSLSTQIISRHPAAVVLDRINYLQQSDTLTRLSLQHNRLYSFRHTARLPETLSCSNPYWLSEPASTGLFRIPGLLFTGKAENDPAATVTAHITVAGLPLTVRVPLVYKSVNPVRGEVYRPFEILPDASITFSEKVFLFKDVTPQILRVSIEAHTDGINGTLQVSASPGWEITLSDTSFRIEKKGDRIVKEVQVKPGTGSSSGNITASLLINGHTLTHSLRRIEYDHIPPQFTLHPAEARLVKTDLKIAGKNIGYIPGSGDDIPAVLKQMGYEVTVLTDELLATVDLQAYNAIVTGVRAYNTNEQLAGFHGRLMDYVQQGGNLVVQYNTNSRVGPLRSKIGPWPFTISRNRVTDETAEVRFVKTNHPALRYPNSITPADFEGWVQERGIYFATETGEEYETILSMNDPGEQPQEGSLIVGKYGKGNFVYTGISFFRQLPAGVSGACRLFVNLLSLPQHL